MRFATFTAVAVHLTAGVLALGCSPATQGLTRDAANVGLGGSVGGDSSDAGQDAVGGPDAPPVDATSGGGGGSGTGSSIGGRPGTGGSQGAGGSAGAGEVGAGGAGGAGGGGRGAAGGSSPTGGTAGALGRGGAGGTSGANAYSPCPVAGTACAVLPFGDSITFGVGSNGSGSNGGYRVELFHRARQDGKQITFVGSAAPNGPATVDGVAFPRQHEGHSGFTIDDEPATATLAARSGISPLVAAVMQANKPDIVTLMIGTNDIQHDYDVANAPARLANLIDSIIAADAHTLVVVAQIGPTTDATLNPAVEAFNTVLPDLVRTRAAAGKHILLCDLYHAIANNPGFVTSGRVVADPTVGLMFDWLHPNVAGYVVIGDAWYETLKSALR